MQAIENLKQDFINQGHSEQSAQFHAECKYKADIYFDVNIKNPRRYISPALHNVRNEILRYVKKYLKDNNIFYQREKYSRKTNSKIAIPAVQQKNKSQHNLPADELLLQNAIKNGVTGFNDKSYLI